MCCARQDEVNICFSQKDFLGQRGLSVRTCEQAEYSIFGHALISIKSYPQVLHNHCKAKGSRIIAAEAWHQQKGDSRTPCTSGPISHTTGLSFSHWGPQPNTGTMTWIDGSNNLMLRFKTRTSIMHNNDATKNKTNTQQTLQNPDIWIDLVTPGKIFKLAHCKVVFQISWIWVNCQINLNNSSFPLCLSSACGRWLQWGSYWYSNLFTLHTCLTQTKPEWAVLGGEGREQRGLVMVQLWEVTGQSISSRFRGQIELARHSLSLHTKISLV